MDLITGELTESVAAASSTVTASQQLVAPIAGVPAGPAPRPPRRRGDFLYYGLRNKKLVFGLGLELLLVLCRDHRADDRQVPAGSLTGAPLQHPGGDVLARHGLARP